MALKTRQRIGKYRIRRRIGRGGYADVYEAYDTLEGVSVALKVPSGVHVDPETLDEFRREVRLTARLEHPNILPIKNAEFIDDRLLVAYHLGQGSLADRLRRRLSARLALDYAEQILEAIAHAHEHKIIHCDVKPENLILFPDGRLRLTDFGIAKVAHRTIQASGTGSVGYMAPEQAMGRPSFRSDVFAAGMILYRMLTGHLPNWPLEWPLPGAERLRRVGPEMTEVVRRALEVDPRKRYRDGGHMLAAFTRAKKRALQHLARARARAGTTAAGRPLASATSGRDWRRVRSAQYRKLYGKQLSADTTCGSCGEPLDERMRVCPWCGVERARHDGHTHLPATCPRCERGVKLDWRYCAWCYGGAIGPASKRTYTDRHYEGRCTSPRCDRKELLPFSRYCPWCRAKVLRRWKLAASRATCRRCGCGVARGFWAYCAWCGSDLPTT